VEVVRELRGMGIITVIISSGLSFLVQRVKDDLSIDMAFSNALISQSGFITGELQINVGYDRKGPLVEKVLEHYRLCREEASAVGDGDGDFGMFSAVSLPIGLIDSGSFPTRGGCHHQVRDLNEVVKIIKDYE
jgi:HAD superfamily phosphoserine phosphatase-like hydrolase